MEKISGSFPYVNCNPEFGGNPRRTTFFNSMSGSTTLDTRAGPIERATGDKGQ